MHALLLQIRSVNAISYLFIQSKSSAHGSRSRLFCTETEWEKKDQENPRMITQWTFIIVMVSIRAVLQQSEHLWWGEMLLLPWVCTVELVKHWSVFYLGHYRYKWEMWRTFWSSIFNNDPVYCKVKCWFWLSARDGSCNWLDTLPLAEREISHAWNEHYTHLSFPLMFSVSYLYHIGWRR